MPLPLIAVVDDELAICDLVADVLRDARYRVACYADRASLFDGLAQQRPALLILDLHLEQATSGWDILTQLRSQATMSAMPIMLSTADARFVREHDTQIQALNALVLNKPFELDTLLDAVAQALRA